MKTIFVPIFFLFISMLCSGQISPPVIDLYGGGSAGIGENRPFWNISNQHGKYSLNPYGGIVGFSIEAVDSSKSFLRFDYGLECFYPGAREAGFKIHQGYAAIKTSLLTFWAGRKEEVIGNQDSILSTGGSVWSANARPMPKLVLATPGYVDVPFTKGYVEVNGSLAHGWFEEDRYVKNLYMHQKHAHVRFGGDFFINASVGLIHFAQWGGESPNPRFGVLPSGWDAYKKVFVVKEGDPGAVDTGEVINKLGNHLGARNYRIDYKHERFTTSFYFQTIFEDNSGFSKPFYKDGVKGLVIRTKDSDRLVNHIVMEYIQTTWQSGSVHDISDSIKLVGDDDYYNHYIYLSGWSYKWFTLGTPLITSPVYYGNNTRLYNNRVMALHVGLGGVIGGLDYRTFFTYSTNKGTYKKPSSQRNQFSWYLETTLPAIWQGIDLNIMLAADIGQMYGNNLGVNLLLKRTFRPFDQ